MTILFHTELTGWRKRAAEIAFKLPDPLGRAVMWVAVRGVLKAKGQKYSYDGR